MPAVWCPAGKLRCVRGLVLLCGLVGFPGVSYIHEGVRRGGSGVKTTLDSFLQDLRLLGPPVVWRYTHGAWIKMTTDRHEVTNEYVRLYCGPAKTMEILLDPEELAIRRKPRPDMLVVRCRACYAVNGFELFWPE